MYKKRLLVWIPVTLIVLLGAALAFLFSADLGMFETRIEKLVSDSLGRELRIDGGLSIHLGEQIEVRAGDIHLVNPEWAAEADFVQVDSLQATIRLGSLFNPPIIIDELVVEGASLALETDEDGRATWQFDLPPSDKPKKGRSAGLPLVLGHVDVNEVEVLIDGPGEDDDFLLQVEHLDQVGLDDGMMELVVSGAFNEAPFEYQGIIGPMDSLISGRDLKFEGEGRFTNMTIQGKGAIDDLVNPRQPEFTIKAAGPNLSRLAQSLGLNDPGELPFELVAEAGAAGDRASVNVEAFIGQMTFRLNGLSAGIADFSVVEGMVAAEGPDLGSIMKFFGLGAWPHEPFTLDGAAQRDGLSLNLEDITVVIGSTRFDLGGTLSSFPNLDNAEARLHISGDDVASFRELLGAKGVAEGEFEVDILLDAQEEGRDKFEAFLRTALGQINLSGDLSPGPSYTGSSLKVDIQGDDAAALLSAYGIDGFQPEPFTLSTEFDIEEEGFEFERGALVSLNEDQFEITGFVARDPLKGATNLQIRASGGNIAQFAPLAKVDFALPAYDYELKSGFRVTPAGFRVDALEGRIGDNDVGFDGLITTQPDLAGSDFVFETKGPDLQGLVKTMFDQDVLAKQFSVSGHLRHLDDALRLEDFSIQLDAAEITGTVQAELPIENGAITFSVLASGPDLSRIVPRQERVTLLPNPFKLAARGQARQGAWVIDEGRADLGDASLTFAGSIDLLPQISDTNFQLDLDMPSPSALFAMAGIGVPQYPIQLKGNLKAEPGRIESPDLQLQLGRTDLSGRVFFTQLEAVPRLNLALKSRRVDEDQLTDQRVAKEPAVDDANDGRVIPDIDLPLEQLAALNAVIELDVEEWNSRERTFFNVALDASLQDGALDLKQFKAEGQKGFVDVRMGIKPRNNTTADVTAAVDIEGLVLDLSLNPDIDSTLLPTMNVEMRVQGHGQNVRDVAATSTGYLHANSSGGVVPDSAVSVLDKGIFEQIFGLIMPPTEESTTTNLACFAARLSIDDGMVAADPGAALVTDKVQIVSKGVVNLKTEELDLSFETHPTKAFSVNASEVLINPFVKIGGTMASPAPEFAAGKAFLFGGAAAATGGLSILAKGLFDRMSNAGDPCAAFIQQPD